MRDGAEVYVEKIKLNAGKRGNVRGYKDKESKGSCD